MRTHTIRWHCEHDYTVVHWQPTEASRGYICSPPPVKVEPVEWCDLDNAPAAYCNHDGITDLVFRVVQGRGDLT